MVRLVFAILLLNVALFAQMSRSTEATRFPNGFGGIIEEMASEMEKSVANKKFCEANTYGMNVLALDGYFVVKYNQPFSLTTVDALTTRIFTSDTTRERPVWARVYKVVQASPDSVAYFLKDVRKNNAGKLDQNELNFSFPYQDESIYKYKKFLGKLKAAGFTKIRLLARHEEFGAEVYRKLQLKKYSKKEIESRESIKHRCNTSWLRITDSHLSFSAYKHISQIELVVGKGARSIKGVRDVVSKNRPLMDKIHKKFTKSLPRLKDVKNLEHPDAPVQIEVFVKFTIDPEGKVTRVEVQSSNSENEEFDKAICDEVSTWTFEKADSESKVTLPFKFKKK
ncbi:MAG: TonB family protein [Fibrobacter sp.]|nr:TonB family protein [Fibrobacter sp.]